MSRPIPARHHGLVRVLWRVVTRLLSVAPWSTPSGASSRSVDGASFRSFMATHRAYAIQISTPDMSTRASAVTTCTTGLRTHPTPLAGLPSPPSQAGAKRPTPTPFEHAEPEYAGTGPRPHLVTMDCFDNSHDHRGTEIGIRLPECSHDPGLATCPPVPPSQSSLREHCPPHTGP